MMHLYFVSLDSYIVVNIYQVLHITVHVFLLFCRPETGSGDAKKDSLEPSESKDTPAKEEEKDKMDTESKEEKKSEVDK